MEFRIRNLDAQIDENGIQKIGGYINVTERESEILFSKQRGKWFKEVMKKGVFQRALSNNSTIPLLLEHDENAILASTGNNSLELREDNIGLRFDAVIDNSDVYENVKNGVLNACSFGFRALSERIEPISSRLEKRFVDSIELLEVSLVKNPAYTGSLVEARAYNEDLTEEEKVSLEEEIKEIEAEERAKCEDSDTSDADESKEDEQSDGDEEANEADAEEEKTNDSTAEASKNTSKKEDKKSESRDVDIDGLASAIADFLANSNDDEDDEDDDEDDEVTTVVIGNESDSEPANTTTLDENTKNLIADYVNVLINEKQEAIQEAEVNEEIAQEVLEDFHEYANETETSLQENLMKYSTEILKLRLDLLKLNQIQKGIM